MCLHGLTQLHFITDLVVIVAPLCLESLQRYMSFSAPPHSQPRSPLAQKRCRLDPSVHTTSSPMFLSNLDLDIRHGEGEDDGDETILPTNSREDITQPWGAEINACMPVGQVLVNASGTTQTPPSPRMQHSVEQLEAASQAVRLRVATKERSNKLTPATYRVPHGYGNTRGVSKTGNTGTGTVLNFGTPHTPRTRTVVSRVFTGIMYVIIVSLFMIILISIFCLNLSSKTIGV